MRDYRDAKAMAQSLREALATKTITIGHSESLELVSKMLGFSDWNTLSATIQRERDGAEAQPVHANGSPTAAEERTRKLAEQVAPRSPILFDPAQFDRFTGIYEAHPGVYFKIYREGEKFFSQIAGQGPVQVYPESEIKFFATVVPAQLSFVSDRSGRVTELILHQNGLERAWKRNDQVTPESIEAALQQRIRNNTPQPGSEDALRRFVSGIMSGTPNYHEMVDGQAEAIRQQLSRLQPFLADTGAIESIRFIGISDRGDDIYHVKHERRLFRWTIFLDADGKVDHSWVMSGG